MLDVAFLCATQFTDSSFCRSRDINEDRKRKMAMIRDDWGHSKSLAMTPFDKSHRNSC